MVTFLNNFWVLLFLVRMFFLNFPNDHFYIFLVLLGFFLLPFLVFSDCRFFSCDSINVKLKDVEVNGEGKEVSDAEEGNEELPKVRVLCRRIDVDRCDAQNEETDDRKVEQRPNDPVGYRRNLKILFKRIKFHTPWIFQEKLVSR